MAEEGNNTTTTATAAETDTQSTGILGTVKSYLGLDDKTVASVQDTAASVADAVLPESIKPDAVKGAAGTGAETSADTGADESKDESSSTPADPTTDESKDESSSTPADPTTDESEDKDAAAAAVDNDDDKGTDTAGAGDSGKKLAGTAGGKPQENPDAIPTAGGKKLGEEHWGESKIVPDLPRPADDDTSGVASAAGQPTDEVKNNTSVNTGGAVAGPPQASASAASHTDPTVSGTSSPARSGTMESEKKPKLMDRLKSKFKKDKS